MSFAVTATGNPSPSYSLASGSLPPGLALVAGIGKAYIQGTPAAGSQGVHQVTLSASNGTPPDATQTLEITVRKRAAIVSVPEPTFTVGQAGSATFKASGYPTPTVHLYGTLPTGVSFTDNGDGTGTLSGTPQPGTAGEYKVAFGARDWLGETGQYTT